MYSNPYPSANTPHPLAATISLSSDPLKFLSPAERGRALLQNFQLIERIEKYYFIQHSFSYTLTCISVGDFQQKKHNLAVCLCLTY